MPPIVAAIVVVLASVGLTVTATGVSMFLLSIGASLVLGGISKLITKLTTSSPSISSTVASRSIATRQAEPFED
jgi:predicted phage tail protein